MAKPRQSDTAALRVLPNSMTHRAKLCIMSLYVSICYNYIYRERGRDVFVIYIFIYTHNLSLSLSLSLSITFRQYDTPIPVQQSFRLLLALIGMDNISGKDRFFLLGLHASF